MCPDLFPEEVPYGSILVKNHLPVGDHSVCAFRVVAYGRFNCSLTAVWAKSLSRTLAQTNGA